MSYENMFPVVKDSLNRLNALFPMMFAKKDQYEQRYIVEQWTERLKGLPPAAVAKAFAHIANTHRPKFYGDNPVVADVLDYIAQNTGPGWEEVLQECVDKAYWVQNPDKRFNAETGDYEPVPVQFNSRFSEMVFKAAGGARVFLFSNPTDSVFRAQFRNTYASVKQGLIGSGGWIDAAQSNVVMLNAPRKSSVKRLPDAPVHPEIAAKMEANKQRLEEMRARIGMKDTVNAAIGQMVKNTSMRKFGG